MESILIKKIVIKSILMIMSIIKMIYSIKEKINGKIYMCFNIKLYLNILKVNDIYLFILDIYIYLEKYT